MKILRITLSNIASIAGTHTVDFTQEPLRSAGLFAISGPTGAGKSTLLDALCLALYERTPRLDGVTRKPDIDNESQNAPESLLRRGTGKGFVEVAFVGVDNLPWTARWEVRRARETADGTLQDATMVLYKGHVAPDTKGEVEAGDKKTAVLKAIESKIGLSYDQFTRAVLIAQNDFASFLKVKDKDRADILQKLTGTQQYEQISKNVYLRCQDFVDRLKEKNTLVQGNLPLSIEERERVEESYAIAKKEAEEFETKLSELKKKDTWYRKWTELNDAHAEAEIAYQAVQVENTQALTRQRDLALTEAIKHEAAKLSSDQKTVQSERDVLSQSLAVEEGKIEGLNRDLEIASQAFAHANSALITWKQQESGLRDEIDLARRVDVKIALKAQMCEAAQKSTEEAAEAYKEKQLELDGKNVELGQLKRDLGRIEEDLEFLKPYFTLVEDARLWISHIENALSLENQIIEKQSTLANTQAEVIAAKALVDQQQEKHQLFVPATQVASMRPLQR